MHRRIDLCLRGAAHVLFAMITALACGDEVTDVTQGQQDAASTFTLSVTHNPTDPNMNETVAISAHGSGASAVVNIAITVDDTLVATCDGAICGYTGVLPPGSHTYSATATDAVGRTMMAGPEEFTVWLEALDRSSAPISPHWRHMRTSIIDYRIHYQKEPHRSAEYDWAAARYDHVVGGPGLLSEYKKRNPAIRHFTYEKFWFLPVTEAEPMERWLRANNYDVEAAYLHGAGTTRDSANRLTAQQFAGRDYWYLNLGDPGYRAWRAHRAQQVLAVNADGYQSESFFFDTSSQSTVKKYIPATTLEYASYPDYFADFHAILAEHRAWAPVGYIVLNQAQYFTKSDDIATAAIAGGTMTEYGNTPYGNTRWAEVDQLVTSGITVQLATGVSPGSKGDPRGDMNPGNYDTVAERVLMWEYGSYLMVVDPMRMDAVLFETYGLNWGKPFSVTWLTAFEVDIGLALKERSVVQAGLDGAGQKYNVFKREFANNVLVLARPQGGTEYGDQTAVTVPLPPGRWHMLRPDGSRGNPIRNIELRNSEAVMLVDSDISA